MTVNETRPISPAQFKLLEHAVNADGFFTFFDDIYGVRSQTVEACVAHGWLVFDGRETWTITPAGREAHRTGRKPRALRKPFPPKSPHGL